MTFTSGGTALTPDQAPVRRLFEAFADNGESIEALRGYSLRLADGSRWWLAGDSGASFWVEQLAPVMQLGRQEAAHARLIIFTGNSNRTGSPTALASLDPGWLRVRKANRTLWYRLDTPDLLIQWSKPLSAEEIYVGMRDSLAFIYWESLRRGGLPFHAALAEYQGQGYVLAGASGTGKSTCARRLAPPWRALGDDEALVALTPDGRYVAHPFPTWSEYLMKGGKPTYESEKPVPVAGLFFLEQAEEDDCLPLSPSEALVGSLISSQTALAHFLWYCGAEEGKDIRSRIFANACELVHKVPAFRLRVSLRGRFWEKLAAAVNSF